MFKKYLLNKEKLKCYFFIFDFKVLNFDVLKHIFHNNEIPSNRPPTIYKKPRQIHRPNEAK